MSYEDEPISEDGPFWPTDAYSDVEFLRDQLEEANEEIAACYALLRELEGYLKIFVKPDTARDLLLRIIEARLLPAAKGSTLKVPR